MQLVHAKDQAALVLPKAQLPQHSAALHSIMLHDNNVAVPHSNMMQHSIKCSTAQHSPERPQGSCYLVQHVSAEQNMLHCMSFSIKPVKAHHSLPHDSNTVADAAQHSTAHLRRRTKQASMCHKSQLKPIL